MWEAGWHRYGAGVTGGGVSVWGGGGVIWMGKDGMGCVREAPECLASLS